MNFACLPSSGGFAAELRASWNRHARALGRWQRVSIVLGTVEMQFLARQRRPAGQEPPDLQLLLVGRARLDGEQQALPVAQLLQVDRSDAVRLVEGPRPAFDDEVEAWLWNGLRLVAVLPRAPAWWAPMADEAVLEPAELAAI